MEQYILVGGKNSERIRMQVLACVFVSRLTLARVSIKFGEDNLIATEDVRV